MKKLIKESYDVSPELADKLNSILADEWLAAELYRYAIVAMVGNKNHQLEELSEENGEDEIDDHFKSLYIWMQSKGIKCVTNHAKMEEITNCTKFEIEDGMSTSEIIDMLITAEEEAIDVYETIIPETDLDLHTMLCEFLKDERQHLKDLTDIKMEMTDKDAKADGEIADRKDAYADVALHVDGEKDIGPDDVEEVTESGESDNVVVHVTNIQWDADDPDEVADLPTECDVEVPDDVEDVEEYVSDYITDTYGFTHKGFQMDESLKDIWNATKKTAGEWKNKTVGAVKGVAKGAANKVKNAAHKVKKAIGNVINGPFRKGDRIEMTNDEGDKAIATVTAGTLGGKEYTVLLQRTMMETDNPDEEVIHVTNIQWDADDPHDADGLPTEVDVKVPGDVEDAEEYISDYLSDTYGFTHNGFQMGESTDKQVTESDDEEMETIKTTIIVKTGLLPTINRCLSGKWTPEDMDMPKEDTILTITGKFKDGCQCDIYLHSSEDDFYTDGVLYDKDGHQLAMTEVAYEMDGEWEWEANGKKYICDVIAK